MFSKIKKYLRDIGFFKYKSDEDLIKKQYYSFFKKNINLKQPETFNEKINWLKLYDRKECYTKMVDKYEAKKYASDIIGEEYIIPTYGIYNSFKEIDFDKLPNLFVMKCTHDSGGIFICKDKSKINHLKLKIKFNLIMKRNFYYRHGEWAYKNIKPRIIIEKYMEDVNNSSIRDYKFFCFNGIPKILYVSDDSHTKKQKIAFFDMNYNQLDIKRDDYIDYDILPKKPKNFEKMKQLASKLAKDIPHLRVDFYEINNKIYFGELTFYTGGGLIPFTEEKWDLELGKMLELPKLK